MPFGDFNGDGDVDATDLTLWGLHNENLRGHAKSAKELEKLRRQAEIANEHAEQLSADTAELAKEQRRLSKLPPCPACKKPLEFQARMCANCRTIISWVSAGSLTIPCEKGGEEAGRRELLALLEEKKRSEKANAVAQGTFLKARLTELEKSEQSLDIETGVGNVSIVLAIMGYLATCYFFFRSFPDCEWGMLCSVLLTIPVWVGWKIAHKIVKVMWIP